MRIGIIGSGNMGSALGKLWAKQGHDVMFSFARDPGKLEELAQAAGNGASTGTPAQAATHGELVLLAVPWMSMPDAIKAAGNLSGKILVSCSSPLKKDMSGLEVGLTTSGAEEVAKLAPNAKVVLAFNTAFAQLLAAGAQKLNGETVCVFQCGDDEPSKSKVARLIEESGFTAIDCGPLRNARFVEPMAMLCVQLAYARGMGPKLGLKLLVETSAKRETAGATS